MVAISHLKLGRNKEAGQLIAAMAKDRKVPESIRSRATQMAGSLGFDAVVEPTAKQEGNQ